MSNIKAIFPTGVTEVTVHGLHQWDFGRALEIVHPDLLGDYEVHFAAAGAKEAICTGVTFEEGGVAAVAVPNELLEQSQPIMVWVYNRATNAGETVLTAILPVQARVRPRALTDPLT